MEFKKDSRGVGLEGRIWRREVRTVATSWEADGSCFGL